MLLTSEDCPCDACRNYIAAVASLGEGVRRFFDSLGMDMRKASEVYTHYISDDGLVEYGGFYHICGDIVSGTSPWVLIGKNRRGTTFHLDESKMVPVGNRLKVGFKDECALLPEGFPAPRFQMEVIAHLPWVIDAPINGL